ncbi:MAG: hypothetical protein WB699_16120 [Bacteroidota bacterium]
MKKPLPTRTSPVRILDVAHPPLQPAVVEALLLQEWMAARRSSTTRVIKIIHGYGSTGKGGATRETVRNWAAHMSTKLRGVITGEEYSLYDPRSQAMRTEAGITDDSDLGSGNRGITYLWVR